MRNNYFKRYTCDICKSQATTFRLINDRKFMLCGHYSCDFQSRIRTGFFKISQIGELVGEALQDFNKV